ncbi:MAG: hypothetical protein HW414_147 [Dehalococcoidia bacterium]|nr:hypothetical protein [Dehalococcoidia bacterium]
MALLADGPVLGIRAVLGLSFVLFVPGYVMVNAIYPRRGDLDVAQRLALSFGFSIVVVVILGFMTAYTPWGFRLVPAILTIVLFNLVLTGVAWRRRRTSAEPFHPRFAALFASLRAGSRLEKGLAVLLALVILASAGLLVYLVQPPKMNEKFSEFYLLGPEGKAEKYPGNLAVGQSARVVVGIVNREGEKKDYSVDVAIEDVKVTGFDGIALDAGRSLEQAVEFAASRVGNDQRVDIRLYRTGDDKAYKTLTFWVDVR